MDEIIKVWRFLFGPLENVMYILLNFTFPHLVLCKFVNSILIGFSFNKWITHVVNVHFSSSKLENALFNAL